MQHKPHGPDIAGDTRTRSNSAGFENAEIIGDSVEVSQFPSIDVIRAILGTSAMPRKYQNPKLQIRSDVERAYYFIRVTIPRITTTGRVNVSDHLKT
jgi:hypothetical protein